MEKIAKSCEKFAELCLCGCRVTAAEDFGFRRLFGVFGIRKAAPCMAGESYFFVENHI